jgi:hypothetical protein
VSIADHVPRSLSCNLLFIACVNNFEIVFNLDLDVLLVSLNLNVALNAEVGLFAECLEKLTNFRVSLIKLIYSEAKDVVAAKLASFQSQSCAVF